MAAKKTPWLTYVLLAGGGYVLYKLYESYATPAAATTTTASAATTTAPTAGPLKVIPALPAPAGQTIADQVLAPVPSQLLPVATISPSLPAASRRRFILWYRIGQRLMVERPYWRWPRLRFPPNMPGCMISLPIIGIRI